MRRKLFYNLKRPVVVAMVAVRMMKMSVNQIVHVIAMRNGRVAAIGTMNVLPVVAFRAQRAFVRVGVADGNSVFIHMVAVRMVQMPVVEIIHVPVVHDGDMPAIFAVDVGMVRMSFARMRFVHRFCFLVWSFILCRHFNLTTAAAGVATNVSANNLHNL